MIKKMTCTKCPRGCQLLVDIDSGRVVGVTGNRCSKGEEYARLEVEHPMRILTSSVLTDGLEMKMAPIKTSGPVPKEKLMSVMGEVLSARVRRPMNVGDIVIPDVLGLGVDIVVTRSVR